MRIIPAIDLMGGVVVHGVAGRRAEYRPLKSSLAADSRPATVARGLIDTLGLSEFYVADLDAIGGHEPDWESYNALIKADAKLWIDAGVADLGRDRELSAFIASTSSVTGIIIGLESLIDASQLNSLGNYFGLHRLIFSLDLIDGRPRAAASQWKNSSPLEITADVAATGVRRLIVLDVAAVGLGQGCPTLDLCRELRRRYSDLEITSGGGIRTMADLEQLTVAGCDIALVATALHDGRIGRADLKVP
ncbi:MAG: hisA/hisF family protein [Planctomycetia bacterium]|nr:hisA/hisF family protein [Planctomycetia bacterium]